MSLRAVVALLLVAGSAAAERTIARPHASGAPDLPVAPAPAAAPTPFVDPAAELYRSADAALVSRDLAAADRALARIADEHAGSPLVAQALFDRARIAFQQRAWSRALRQLDRLAALGSSPLAEPGAYLACRVALAAGDEGAARCLSDYRAAYPRSPHDLEVLGTLADLAYRAGGCGGASAQRDELFRRFPASALARTWAERCREPR